MLRGFFVCAFGWPDANYWSLQHGVDGDTRNKLNQIQLNYYMGFEQYQEKQPDAKKMQWRIEQSVAALYFTEGYAKLI